MQRICRIAAAAIVSLAVAPTFPCAGETDAEKPVAEKANAEKVDAQKTSAEATDAVAFDVKVVSGGTRWGPPETTWRMTYTKDRKTATFRVTLPHKVLGKGTFSRDPSSHESATGQGKKSDTSVLLRDLGKALRGKVPAKVDQVDKLPVTFYVLGDKMTRTKTGSFKVEPASDWLLVKIFVKTDKRKIRRKDLDQATVVGDWPLVKTFVATDQGEFYLNINEKTGKAEIRMKSSDYGDAVLGELAKVFSPSASTSESSR